MSKKNIFNVLSILGILVLVLSIVGCQGYQAPKYKAPDAEAQDEEWEEISDDEWDVDFEEDLEDETEEVEAYKPAPAVEPRQVEPAREVESAYTPATNNNVETESDYRKSPYRPIKEEDLPTLTVTEGDLVKINVKATDVDGDPLTYTFTSPLNSDGKWQTRSGDTGAYYSDITVSDGKTEVEKRVKIVVEPKNNKPELNFIPNIFVNEGETVQIKPTATDGDGDRLTYGYSGWMTTSTKKTGYQDAGVHKVIVSVTDGISTVSQEVTVTVTDVNRPPQVELEF